MTATAASKVNNKICTTKSKDRRGVLIPTPWFPNKTRSKWPAIMLAAKRTAKVPGRITFLIVSIKTIKGINGPGVPKGTKWASICRVWLNHPYTIKLIQRGIDRARVMDIWLVPVKT